MFPSNASGNQNSNSRMRSRDVSGRSERYHRTYEMYKKYYSSDPPARYWPAPSSSSSSSPSWKRAKINQPPLHSSQPTSTKKNLKDMVTLHVVASFSGERLSLKMRRTTPLQKLFDRFCNEMKFEQPHLVSFFDGGIRLDGSKTPDELELEDEDELLAILRQNGC